MADAPIFVVGAPRSGTTLLASMLAGHPRIACGPETQFFNKLSPEQLRAAVADRAWPERGVRLVSSLTLAGQAVVTLFGHTERDLREFLAVREPSVGALLESLTELYARKRGKVRWAEKTPNHLLHLPALRRYYPHAPVVRIVRDPRDSALSMRQLPWASPSALANAHLWAAWFGASQPFFEQDARSFTVRYEDLVSEPGRVLSAVCGFVGESFEPGMLEFARTARDVSSPQESWKAVNARALDAGRSGRWRRENPTLQRALTYTCREGLEAFGYLCAETPERAVRAHPLGLRAAEAHEETLLRAAARETHFGQAERPAAETDLVLLPAKGPRKTLLRTLRAEAALLCTRRARGLRTYYLRPGPGRAGWTGQLSLALCRLFAEPYPLERRP